MKLFAGLLILLFSANVFAQEQLPLFPEAEYKHRLKKLLDEGCEHVHNGDCSVQKYDVKIFEYGKTLRSIISNHYSEWSSWQYVPVLEWRDILRGFYITESGVAKNLEYFLNNKLVKAMYGLIPDESCDESESCSYEHIYIYMKNGDVVYFGFDYTT